MNGIVGTLVDTSDFPARWHCGNWTDFHGWVHIIADIAIFGAYTAIPMVLVYFLLKKGDISFPAIGWLFSIFILACGTSHLVEAGIFWWPAYRVAGTMKVITACVSWLTVIALIRIAPKAMELPGLATLNASLQAEVQRRAAVELELITHREELQDQVNLRTQELQTANAALKLHTRELENSNQALRDFAYIASHDLQEPLRKIRTFGSRLVDSAGEQLDDRSTDNLTRITSAAERMQSMIDGLLDYSRVTMRQDAFKRVDLNEVVEEVLETLELRIQQHDAIVDVGTLPTIDADPIQMVQLLQNLIGNALKFVRPDNRPEISVQSRITESDELELLIADNGIGIDPDHVSRLFQPFTRLNAKSAYEGSGIGLSICRKIVDRHQGRIDIQGALGEGTTFVITFPKNSETAVQAAPSTGVTT